MFLCIDCITRVLSCIICSTDSHKIASAVDRNIFMAALSGRPRRQLNIVTFSHFLAKSADVMAVLLHQPCLLLAALR